MTALSALFAGLTVCCGAAALPGVCELLMLTVAGILPVRRSAAGAGFRPAGSRRVSGPFRLVVIVPAHDEEPTIQDCLHSILAADRGGVDLDLVVVADNCTDGTAARVRELGVRVLERTDLTRRGKGYALDFAFRKLLSEASAPAAQGFAVVDADSAVAGNFLAETAALLRAGADAVQCRYCARASDLSARSRLSVLAVGAFNILRARGRARLGTSAGIYGNGFALSAATIRQVPYTACSVVEDVEYHLALVGSGRRVRFADDTAVYANLPAAGSSAAGTQRMRWEGGRLRLLASQVPSLLGAVLSGRWALLEPLLDLLVLPLAYQGVLLALALLSPFPPVRTIGLAGFLIVFFHLLAAIRVTGGGVAELRALAAAPFYLTWKLLLLPRLAKGARRDAAWVRTARHSAPARSPDTLPLTK